MTYAILDLFAKNKKHLGASLLGIIMVGSMVVPAFAQQASTSFSEPVSIQASVAASDCDNAPGTQITLSGSVALAQVGVQLTFQNNVKGTHTYTDTSTVSVTVIPSGQSIQIPKQPVLGGVGGNPYIYLQFVDANG